jgi:hypothetical protein
MGQLGKEEVEGLFMPAVQRIDHSQSEKLLLTSTESSSSDCSPSTLASQFT